MKTLLLCCVLLGAAIAAGPGYSQGRYPWEDEPPSLWTRDFSGSPRDQGIPLPTTPLENEGIGTKLNVHGVFDRWTLNREVHAGRGTQYADITQECKGLIELDFAHTAEEWLNPAVKSRHYRGLDALITRVGEQLLLDYGNRIEGQERADFLQALHALGWQESLWQHYIRHKNWFFVFLSGGSYNKLDDWGVSQVARSGFVPSDLLNESFFTSKGHCSIGSTLYYGFMEYYFLYVEARRLACNETPLQKLVGAYNMYSSGFSHCHNGLSEDKAFRNYQIKAMGGFTRHYQNKTWLGHM